MPELERAPRADKRGCDHIFFIGFLGAGKSTLARNLGRLFHRRYVDTDRLVERRSGMSISTIFEPEGEERFRLLETEALESLGAKRSLLISCGGGIVETPRNIALMHGMGYCVYLDGDLDDSIRQIRSLENRPDFGSPQHAAGEEGAFIPCLGTTCGSPPPRVCSYFISRSHLSRKRPRSK